MKSIARKRMELLAKGYVRGCKAYDTDPKAKAEIDELNRQLYKLFIK